MEPVPPPTKGPKVLFAVTEDWYFRSHREPLARMLQSMGCKIIVATRFNTYEAELMAAGFECIAIPFERSLRHPLRDLLALVRLCRTVRRRQPDVVHLVSLKPILLSVLSMFVAPRTRYIAAFTGMGYLFSSRDQAAKLFQRTVVLILRMILRRRDVWVIVQNEDDRALLATQALGSSDRTILIPGVGVDLDRFTQTELPVNTAPLVLLPARLIRDKGIEEFVRAAALVKRTNEAVRFILVGALDDDNPAAFAPSTIDEWVRGGAIEWWGHQQDMAETYRLSTVVCLPSYREGLPKVLLEASACGRPLVATDVAGCRDICRNGINGTLVPVRDAEALANAVLRLLAAPSTCAAYGDAGRRIVEREYSVDHIAQQTLSFYDNICGRGTED